VVRMQDRGHDPVINAASGRMLAVARELRNHAL
jgi:hypothetical protein